MQEQTKLTWNVDPGHSNVQFKVKHMGIANIAGMFSVFEGQVISDSEDFLSAVVTFEIDAKSITTNNNTRDEHLRSNFFFDTDKFPKLSFKGSLRKSAKGYKLAGELTIRDITTKINLPTKITGTGLGRWGDTRVGFEIDGLLNRKKSGLTFNVLTDAGGVIVGDEVKLHMDIELIKS